MITSDSKKYLAEEWAKAEARDAEYESIRTIFAHRNRSGNQLPGKTVHFIPEETAPAVLAIDNRIQQLREHMPQIVTGAVVLSFLIGLAL